MGGEKARRNGRGKGGKGEGRGRKELVRLGLSPPKVKFMVTSLQLHINVEHFYRIVCPIRLEYSLLPDLTILCKTESCWLNLMKTFPDFNLLLQILPELLQVRWSHAKSYRFGAGRFRGRVLAGRTGRKLNLHNAPAQKYVRVHVTRIRA